MGNGNGIEPFIVVGMDAEAVGGESFGQLRDVFRASTAVPTDEALTRYEFDRSHTVRPEPFGFRTEFHTPGLTLSTADLDEGWAPTWARNAGLTTTGRVVPALKYFPLGDLPSLDLRRIDDDIAAPYRGNLFVGGSWMAEDDAATGFDDLDLDCDREPALVSDLFGTAPPPPDGCPPGSVRAMQPRESRDFVRWAFHFGEGRPLETGRGDGLDQALADPERHLEPWTGQPIPRSALVVGRFRDDPCSYPAVSLGDGLGFGLLDGVGRTYRIEANPHAEVFFGPYPFTPFEQAVLEEAGCLPRRTMIGAGLAFLVGLAVIALLVLSGDGGGDDTAVPTPSSNLLTTSTQPTPSTPIDDPEPTASADDPVDLQRVSDRTPAPDADPLAEITELSYTQEGGDASVKITVSGTFDPSATERDSSAYQILVEYADGTTAVWVWEVHLGARQEGANLDGGQDPAEVTFDGNCVIFRLPPDQKAITRVGARAFSNPDTEGDDSGPEFFDEAFTEPAA